MSSIRAMPKSTLLFWLGLAVLYAGIMAAKFALWHGNVLMNDWAFFNNSFWNTNFRDLWLFSHDRYTQFGYPSYLNEHFAPFLLVIAALYHVVPQPEAMLLLLHGASPIIAAIFIHATAQQLSTFKVNSAVSWVAAMRGNRAVWAASATCHNASAIMTARQ